MSDDDMGFFGAPPSGDAPILLGPPSDDPFGGGNDFGDYAAPTMGDFAVSNDFGGNDFGVNDDFTGGGGYVTVDDPSYLGEINEAPSGEGMILLGGPTTDAPPEPPMPPEPVGPTPMQIWNDEWQETLKQRKDEENTRKAELIEQARIAMEKFQAEREQRRETTMSKNRDDEQAKLEAIEADLENDNSWQRVCKMIELSQDNAAESKDVKRMKDILIYLKNDTTKAAALSS